MEKHVPDQRRPPLIRIAPWTNTDLDLLHLMNTPRMTQYLGGPESEQQIRARHHAYLHNRQIDGESSGRRFSIILLPDHEKVGTIGYWESRRNGAPVYEIGWRVIPGAQRRGVATTAGAAAIARAKRESGHRYLHAFTVTGNVASHATCRRIGFTHIAERQITDLSGNRYQCDEWRLDLTTTP
ncbi:GNAT family N-acetyltransferase [Kitasatospora sp. cg17-2]